MKTLIEIYDSPIDNVLATEVFRPEETILLCPPEVEADQEMKKSIREYFRYRNCPVKLTFIPVSLYDARTAERVLREVLQSHHDCAIDISGGTDASLFAAGAVSGEVPVFTYSRKRNTFYEIENAAFARGMHCDLRLDVRSCLLMAGGTLLPGREDNAKLENRLQDIDRLFEVYRTYRRIWNWQISFIQKISSSEPGELQVDGPLTGKAGNKSGEVDTDLFRALAEAGLILDLQLTEDRISFRFPDETVRFWLRDIGSVLELQVYRAALEAGCFDDVVLSALVSWQGKSVKSDTVLNEIDVMAVRGIQPFFISCKTCEIHTEALNELSILRDRFGGKYSRAMIVTSGMATKSRLQMRSRAAKLGIEVVEWEEIRLDRLIERLRGHR